MVIKAMAATVSVILPLDVENAHRVIRLPKDYGLQ